MKLFFFALSSSSSHIQSTLLISVTTVAVILFLSTFPILPPHPLLSSAHELTTKVASSPLLAFCTCNAIIFLLLRGSTSGSLYDEDGNMFTSMESVDIKEDQDEADEEETIEDDNKDDDDELRRRVEEFITKVSKGWMTEKAQELFYV